MAKEERGRERKREDFKAERGREGTKGAKKALGGLRGGEREGGREGEKRERERKNEGSPDPAIVLPSFPPSFLVPSSSLAPLPCYSSLTVASWEYDVAFFGSEKDRAAVTMRRMHVI